MAKVAIPASPRIVKNGGPITDNIWKGDNSSVWKKGCLLKLASGVIAVCDALGTASALDTDDTGAAGARLFIALEDVDAATAGYVAVQEITKDTVFEGRLCASASSNPTNAVAATQTLYAGYQLTTGVWGVDVDNTTKPLFEIVNKGDELYPFDPDIDDDYGKVWFTISDAVFVL